MKYREKKTECAKEGCRRLRRNGGRYCAEHHAAAMRELRRADPGKQVERAVTRAVVHARGRSGVTPEMKEKIARLAAQVARQIEELNGGAA